MKKRTSLLSLILFVNIVLLAQNEYQYSPPELLDDGWETADLRAQQIDTSRIYQLFNQLLHGGHKLHSVLLATDGRLIIEEYFDDQTVNTRHDLRSATKSITSILMGIAIEEGFIEDIDDPFSKYIQDPTVKKNPDGRKDNITLRHLLSMSSGLDCNDWDTDSKGQEDKVYRKDDWLQYFLDLPLINEPGTVSSYCTMGQVLATEVISRASGMTIDAFAAQYLFNPLNITNVSWGHTSKEKGILPSAKRLYMTSRDMAKIGQLVLNKGKWNEKQLVSEEWLKESTSEKTTINGRGYGFLWWKIPFQLEEKIVTSIAATGNGGQYILIIPEMELVAVFTGGAYNSQEDKLPFAIMQDIFLHTFSRID